MAFSPALALMSLMVLGWWLRRIGFLGDHETGGLIKLLFWVLLPANLFVSGLRFNLGEVNALSYVFSLYLLFTVTMVLSWFLARFRRFDRPRTAAVVLSNGRSNVLYVAMPMVSLWMGIPGEAAMAVFVTLTMPFYNLVPLLASEMALTGRLDRRSCGKALKKAVLNPVFIAPALAMTMALTGTAEFLPHWTVAALKILGQGSTAMALLVIGASLELGRLHRMMGQCWPDMVVKLLFQPAVMVFIYWLWPLPDRVLMDATIITCAAAPAFNCYILAQSMGMDGPYTAGLLACSTVVGAGTMTLWMMILPGILG